MAQWKAELLAQRPKAAKLVANERLHEYVQDRLSGQVRRLDDTPVAGPVTALWKGRNKPRRQDRRWARAWSPEQISHRLKVEFPENESMRISPEAIYQALYVQSRGALKRELAAWEGATCAPLPHPSTCRRPRDARGDDQRTPRRGRRPRRAPVTGKAT